MKYTLIPLLFHGDGNKFVTDFKEKNGLFPNNYEKLFYHLQIYLLLNER